MDGMLSKFTILCHLQLKKSLFLYIYQAFIFLLKIYANIFILKLLLYLKFNIIL